VTKIGDYAFCECTGLTSIEIPVCLVEHIVDMIKPIPIWDLSSITIRLTEKLPDNAKDVPCRISHCYLYPWIITLKVPAGCGEAYRHHPAFGGWFKEILEVLD
jgi:hypothetical protein